MPLVFPGVENISKEKKQVLADALKERLHLSGDILRLPVVSHDDDWTLAMDRTHDGRDHFIFIKKNASLKPQNRDYVIFRHSSLCPVPQNGKTPRTSILEGGYVLKANARHSLQLLFEGINMLCYTGSERRGIFQLKSNLEALGETELLIRMGRAAMSWKCGVDSTPIGRCFNELLNKADYKRLMRTWHNTVLFRSYRYAEAYIKAQGLHSNHTKAVMDVYLESEFVALFERHPFLVLDRTDELLETYAQHGSSFCLRKNDTLRSLFRWSIDKSVDGTKRKELVRELETAGVLTRVPNTSWKFVSINYYTQLRFIIEYLTERKKALLHFPESWPESVPGLTDKQSSLFKILKNENVVILCGAAGTGKTRVLKSLIGQLEILEDSGAREGIYYVLCMTASAASLFGGRNARTIDWLITKAQRGSGIQLSCVKLLIIDEFSLMPDQKLFQLLLILKRGKFNGKLIFSGDDKQLKPINGICSLVGLRGAFPHVELIQNHRLQDRENDLSRFLGDYVDIYKKVITGEAKRSYKDLLSEERLQPGDGSLVFSSNISDLVLKYREEKKTLEEDGSVIPGAIVLLAHTNNDVNYFTYVLNGETPPGALRLGGKRNHNIPQAPLKEKDTVMVTRNCYAKVYGSHIVEKLNNGTLGTLEENVDGELIVNIGGMLYKTGESVPTKERKDEANRELLCIRSSEERKMGLSKRDISHGCATTFNKAQGQQWQVVFIYVEGGISHKMFYTGVSRARSKVYVYSPDMSIYIEYNEWGAPEKLWNLIKAK